MDKELQSLVTTADNLVKKLREVQEDPRFTAVFQFWANHGMRYTGPFYNEELDSLERAVKHFTNDSFAKPSDRGSEANHEG